MRKTINSGAYFKIYTTYLLLLLVQNKVYSSKINYSPQTMQRDTTIRQAIFFFSNCNFQQNPSALLYFYRLFIHIIQTLYSYDTDFLFIQILIMNDLQECELKSYKTIIIGRTMVGKSALLLRFVDGQYNLTKPTIGIDYRFKIVTHQGVDCKLQIWDSAGQERYRNIVYNYFTLSKAAVVVFDLTNEKSLDDARSWLQQLINHCGNEIPKILLGNKLDLLTPVDLQENLEKYNLRIQELKQEFNCEFFIVSARTGENVDAAFSYLVGQIYETNNKKTQPQTIKSPGLKLNSSILDQNKTSGKTNVKNKCC